MRKFYYVLLTFLSVAITNRAQNNVGISDDNSSPKASAMLDVNSASKGMLIPRIALTATTTAAPVTSPETSLMIYNTATTGDVTPGYYYWNGTLWVRVVSTTDPAKNLNLVSKSATATLLKTETMVLASNDITLTLPAVTSADNGLEITIKNVGSYLHLITVLPESGKFLDGVTSSFLTRWHARTYVVSGSNWVVRDKETRTDNSLEVSALGSFTTVAEVIAFLNVHITGPTVVSLGAGTYNIAATQTISLAYPVTFQGSSFGETMITGIAGVSGTPLFTCATECYFKMIVFTAFANTTGNDAIRFTGTGEYHEVKDCTFDGFNKGIVTTNNTDLWIFEIDFQACNVGVEIAAGTASGGRLRLSENDFVHCAKGINLLSGVGETVSIINSTFYNTTSGTDIGIFYTPDAGNFVSFVSMVISNNAYNNQGTFVSGFDFARTDGRDANVYLLNNSGMENENPHCKLTLLNNPTGVAAAGTTYTKATWSTSTTYLTTYTTKWDLTTITNRFLYLPKNNSDVVMWISGNVSTGNSARTMNVGLCKGGVTTTRYGETTVRTSSDVTRPTQFSTIVYLPAVSQGNYYELWFNFTGSGTDNVIFSDLNWWVDAK